MVYALEGTVGNDTFTLLINDVGGFTGVDGGNDHVIANWSSLSVSVTMNAGSIFVEGGGIPNATFGGADFFTVSTGTGADFLQGRPFASTTGESRNDVFNSGAGNDVIDSGAGIDQVNGGTGTDTWIANKFESTVAIGIDLNLATSTYLGIGSVSGIEIMNLTTGSGNDDITPLSQFFNDVINTREGNDTIRIVGTNTGRDTVDGGDGADHLIIDWSASTAIINANFMDPDATSGFFEEQEPEATSNRVTFTNIERVTVTSGSGNDNLNTGGGNDVVNGGDGNDTLTTGFGNDVVDGGAGRDSWVANKSNFTSALNINLNNATSTYGVGGSITNMEAASITGGSGDDVLVTQSIFFGDSLVGGLGNDTFTAAGGIDGFDGGAGTDHLIVDWAGVDYAINTSFFGALGSPNGFFSGSQPTENKVDFTAVERFTVKGGSAADNIQTGSGDGADTLMGGGGDDTLNGGGGIDVIDGGTGNDRWIADMSASVASVSIDLTQATSLFGGGGSVTNVESATLTTGAGNDAIKTGAGFFNDTITTGAGDDTVTVLNGQDTVHGKTGTDTLVIDWSGVSEMVLAFRNSGDAEGQLGSASINGQPLGTRVDYTGIDRLVIRGGSVADALEGSHGDDVIDGGGGFDSMRGLAGNDVYVVDSVGEVVDEQAGSGIDEIRTAVASFVLVGEHLLGAIENLRGLSDGGQNLTGNGLDNLIVGAGGADVLSGVTGNDTLRGGAGADALNGGDGFDTADASEAVGVVYVDFASAPGQFNDGMGSIDTMSSIEGAFGGSGDDGLIGDASGNFFGGNGGTDVLLGGGGDDFLFGGAGERDYLMGGATFGPAETGTGNDLADGGDGVDVIYTQDGNDTINGGAAGDFILAGTGDDAADGGTGDDFIFGGSDYVINQAGAGNDTLRGGDGLDFIVGGQGNDFLFGDSGNDILYGGSGVDALEGGAGDDNLVAGDGADTLAGGAGQNYLFGEGGVDTYVVRPGDGATIAFGATSDEHFRFQGFAGIASFAQLQPFLSAFGSGTQFFGPAGEYAIFENAVLTAANTEFVI